MLKSYDADKFTKEYYSEKFNVTEWPQPEPEPEAVAEKRDISIETKPPKLDAKKLLEYQGKLLRFRGISLYW